MKVRLFYLAPSLCGLEDLAPAAVRPGASYTGQAVDLIPGAQHAKKREDQGLLVVYKLLITNDHLKLTIFLQPGEQELTG